MAYSFSGRVRYSEIGENGLLTLPGILNYFQDCSTFQSEDIGLGTEVLKAKKKAFSVSWKKQAKQTSGYQIQYAVDAKFKKSVVAKNVNNTKKVKLDVSKLKAKKKYYIRVRTYKTVKVNGKSKKIYSGWSKVKAVTTKK